MASWEECNSIIQEFRPDYSLLPADHEQIYKYAMEVPAGGVVMELGICYGRTAAILAYCARVKGFEAHGIDAFLLAQNFDVTMLREKLANANLPYTVHYGLTNEIPVLDRQVISWDRPLDLLLIDASHNDPWVTADFKRWIPFIKVGGIGIFDDVELVEDIQSPHHALYLAAHKYTDGWQEEFQDERILIRRRIS
jgi:hypothetical protein